MNLDGKAFGDFFTAVHSREGAAPVVPYTWQQRLAEQVLAGAWPEAINVPTGLGKTGAITAAVFAMAARGDAPTRLVYVVDRRTVVDAAYDHGVLIQERLRTAEPGTVLAQVADRLRERGGLFNEVLGSPEALVVSRLRGGEPRDEDWFQSPIAPAVIVGTVDQIGSRLLHRAYGERSTMWPIHAGLIGMDSLLLLDEPHLSVSFLQTLGALDKFQPRTPGARVQPVQTVVLGATLPQWNQLDPTTTLALNETDRRSPAVRRHLDVRKPLALALGKKDMVESLVNEAVASGARRIGVMVNTVDEARKQWSLLSREHDAELVIGRSRPVDRAEIEARLKTLCGPEAQAANGADNPVIVVATQTLEVGADLSFDTVISEAAPWPSLVQRAGRLLRRAEPHAGRFIVTPSTGPHLGYGDATGNTLDALKAWVADGDADMGFHGIEAAQAANRFGPECYPPVAQAPVLLPEHVRTWSRTSPVPVRDIAVAPFLHGITDSADDVRIIWRQGISALIHDPEIPDPAKNTWSSEAIGVDVLPYRPAEAVEVPIRAAKSFLRGATTTVPVDDDVSPADGGDVGGPHGIWKDFLVQTDRGWEHTIAAVRPGATVLLDVSAGGLLPRRDATSTAEDPIQYGFAGWSPTSHTPVTDRSEGLISSSLARLRLSTLVKRAQHSEGDLGDQLTQIHDALTAVWTEDLSPTERTRTMEEISENLRQLIGQIGREFLNGDDATTWTALKDYLKPGWIKDTTKDKNTPTDWVLTLRATTTTRSQDLVPQTITAHGTQVAVLAKAAAQTLDIASQVDLVHAALHHDDGKIRREWQRSIGVASPSSSLDDACAKSGTNPSSWERKRARVSSGLEPGWSHAALSAAMLSDHGTSDLAVHLAGSHHGQGRPFYRDHLPERQEQQLATDQADRFARLIAEHGPWGLALQETILRLSDWTASGHPTSPALIEAAATFESIEAHYRPDPEATRTKIRLSGLSGNNLADYCTAVGMLRMLTRIDPRTTLAWDGMVPVMGWAGTVEKDDPGLLRTALNQVLTFHEEVTYADTAVEITGGKSGIDQTRAHYLATAYSSAPPDTAAWFSGTHDETVRQKGDPTKVSGSAGAIWTMGRTSPWAQIDTTCKDFATSRTKSKKATKLRAQLDEINNALIASPGTLHMCRTANANTYGIDFRSGSYRAKADRDAGYIPFLVALTHIGFNTLYRPRTRTTTVNGSRTSSKDPMTLDLWLHTTPLTLEGIHTALAVARTPNWLGEASQRLTTTQVTTGRGATFYTQGQPTNTPRK
jgi:CRISPR-associated endonuclease/helicase Cas3